MFFPEPPRDLRKAINTMVNGTLWQTAINASAMLVECSTFQADDDHEVDEIVAAFGVEMGKLCTAHNTRYFVRAVFDICQSHLLPGTEASTATANAGSLEARTLRTGCERQIILSPPWYLVCAEGFAPFAGFTKMYQRMPSAQTSAGGQNLAAVEEAATKYTDILHSMLLGADLIKPSVFAGLDTLQHRRQHWTESAGISGGNIEAAILAALAATNRAPPNVDMSLLMLDGLAGHSEESPFELWQLLPKLNPSGVDLGSCSGYNSAIDAALLRRGHLDGKTLTLMASCGRCVLEKGLRPTSQRQAATKQSSVSASDAERALLAISGTVSDSDSEQTAVDHQSVSGSDSGSENEVLGAPGRADSVNHESATEEQLDTDTEQAIFRAFVAAKGRDLRQFDIMTDATVKDANWMPPQAQATLNDLPNRSLHHLRWPISIEPGQTAAGTPQTLEPPWVEYTVEMLPSDAIQFQTFKESKRAAAHSPGVRQITPSISLPAKSAKAMTLQEELLLLQGAAISQMADTIMHSQAFQASLCRAGQNIFARAAFSSEFPMGRLLNSHLQIAVESGASRPISVHFLDIWEQRGGIRPEVAQKFAAAWALFGLHPSVQLAYHSVWLMELQRLQQCDRSSAADLKDVEALFTCLWLWQLQIGRTPPNTPEPHSTTLEDIGPFVCPAHPFLLQLIATNRHQCKSRGSFFYKDPHSKLLQRADPFPVNEFNKAMSDFLAAPQSTPAHASARQRLSSLGLRHTGPSSRPTIADAALPFFHHKASPVRIVTAFDIGEMAEAEFEASNTKGRRPVVHASAIDAETESSSSGSSCSTPEAPSAGEVNSAIPASASLAVRGVQSEARTDDDISQAQLAAADAETDSSGSSSPGAGRLHTGNDTAGSPSFHSAGLGQAASAARQSAAQDALQQAVAEAMRCEEKSKKTRHQVGKGRGDKRARKAGPLSVGRGRSLRKKGGSAKDSSDDDGDRDLLPHT